eukprot:SAG22_NODE_699_length_7801_cov_6.003116_4_plen_157_part_00
MADDAPVAHFAPPPLCLRSHKADSVFIYNGTHGIGPYCTAMENHGITLFAKSVKSGCGNTKLIPDWATECVVPYACEFGATTKRVLCDQAAIVLPGEPDPGKAMASLPRTVCQAQLAKLAELGLSFFSAVRPADRRLPRWLYGSADSACPAVRAPT